MVVGTAPERPMELAVGLFDGQIVDAGIAMVHQSLIVELPVLVAVGAVPVAGVIMTLVGEADGDAGSVEGPEFLDEAIVEFATPLSGEELDDFVASVDKFGAVSPYAVHGVDEGDLLGIAGVPAVFGFADFSSGSFAGEGRDQIWRGLCAHLFSVPFSCS